MTDHAMPLFDRFAGTRGVPWTPLVDAPTPVEAQEWLAELTGSASVWIKRDDLSASRYGGNKVRKLEFLLGEARESGATDLVTFGAAGSNHALATAIHGAAAGFMVHSFLMPQPDADYVRRNLLASTAVGADLHFALDRRSALGAAAQLRRQLYERGGVPFVIPFGGTAAASTAGFVNAGLELARQVEEGLLPEPDLLFVPLGSMGTAAGLIVGMRAAGMATQVAAVPVLSDDGENIPLLLETIREAERFLRAVDDTFPSHEWTEDDFGLASGFLGDGYAYKTPEGQDAVQLMLERASMQLETTYTGKAMAALLAAGRTGALRGLDVLFWDTYNSRDISDLVDAGDPTALPLELRRYIGEASE